MPIIHVKNHGKNATVGVKLAEDVTTALGGLLFPKGTVLYEREWGILEAFMIEQVHVEDDHAAGIQWSDDQPAEAQPVSEETSSEKQSFRQSFNKAVAALKNLLVGVEGGQNIPVMEVREVIAPLLRQVQDQPEILFTLNSMSRVDSYAYEHSIAVGLISYMIAKWMKIPEREWMQIALAGTLLDVGKTRIDRRILQKPDKLTRDEFEEMKKHTVYGYQIIKASPGLNEGVALAALQHHEREDGSGYPLGLTGNRLHLYSKIVAVADVYHAMCSDRVYQRAIPSYLVTEQLLRESFGKLDPYIVLTFVNGITRLAVGTIVELSDGSIGKVVFTDRSQPTRPMVETGGRIINLAESRHLSIVKVIKC